MKLPRYTLAACLTILSSFLFFLSSPAHAAGWRQLTAVTTNDLYGVDCGSASTCVAVGDAGTIVYTTNKLAWSLGTSGVSGILKDVDMVSSTTGFAVGASGTILKTVNGGATWSALTSGSTETLNDIFMASTTVGWVVGEDGTIRKTTDGTTWSSVSTMSDDLRAVDATSTSTVWVAGKFGAVYRSSNGGTTWTSVPYSVATNIYAIDALSSTTALIGGENMLIAKTENSGVAWASLGTLSGFSASETVVDLSFWTTSSGNAIGNMGGIVGTTNAGTTWSEDVATFSGDTVHADAATPAVGARYIASDDGFVAFYDNYGPNAPTDVTVDGSLDNDDFTNDTTPTMTWTSSTDDEGSAISYYEYSLDDGASWDYTSDAMSHTFGTLAVGSYSVELRGVDELGNLGESATLNFLVDTTAPTVGSVTPITATAGTSTTFTVTASDALAGVRSCTLYRGTASMGVMSYSGGTGNWSASASVSTAGSYSLFATCADYAGNSASGTAATLTVTAAATPTTPDTTAPIVGLITPTNTTENIAVVFSALYSDTVGVTSCTLYVSGSSAGSMTLSGGTAHKTYTFSASGTFPVYARCSDAAGNSTSGSSAMVTVAAATSTAPPSSTASEGTLLKMQCGSSADVNDPCRAVYYYGDDGKRHAFPNEAVFFTWYNDFDDVIVVTNDFMASLTLGHNVTYHPGTRLVKFITVNTVYAVGENGELRGITTESIAASLYGTHWNTTMVDDISDAFYGNYSFGTIIDAVSDYNVSDVTASVSSIDDVL